MHKILVAEDEYVLRKNLMLILRSVGYNTVSVKTGEEALKMLGERRFDLVITDLVMPLASGEEIIRYVFENCPETAIIVITAYPSADSAIEALKKGVSDYFTKPFRTEEMLESIKKIFEGKKAVPFMWDRLSAYRLTNKEQTALKLLVEDGITGNLELSAALSIKVTTLKQHLTNIYAKFGVNSKSSLVATVIKALR